jgi:eukaryotic-like serine/threonine-protein kinase
MITFSCPVCDQKLRVKDEMVGQKGKCPHCKQAVIVPREQGAAVAARAGTESAPALDLDMPTLLPGQPNGEQRDQKTLVPGAARRKTSGLGAQAQATAAPAGGARTAGFSPELYDFLAPAQAPDEIGRLGGYRILKILGHGGMGVVYQAEDINLKRMVALKVMLPALAASASNRERFVREARAVAGLEHENIVAIYQVNEDRGVPFLAMQFLKGQTLEDRIRKEGKLPIAEVLRIGRETAHGLAAAHGHGLVHRDIKPANLWLESERGRVKILDFGLARSARGDSQLTQQGAVIGTPAYMAPEQAGGKGVDARCDLFSLGCVLYRLCTGQLPFKGTDTIATLMAVATVAPPPPRKLNPEVPPTLSRLVMRLLEKKAAERPASAKVVLDELEAIERDPTADGVTGAAPPPVLTPARDIVERPRAKPPVRERVDEEDEEERFRPSPRRDRERGRGPLLWLIGGGAAVLVALLVVLVVILTSGNDKNDKKGDGPDDSGAGVVPPPPPPPGGGGQPVGGGGQPVGGGGDPGVMAGQATTLTAAGLRGAIRDIDVSRDGKWLASGHAVEPRADSNGEVVIWNLEQKKEAFRLRGFSQSVHAVAFSPDGRLLVTGTGDWRMPDREPEVQVWDLTTRRVLFELRGHRAYVGHVAVSPDGRACATSSHDGTVKVWDLASGREAFTCPDHKKGAHDVIFSPDNRYLVTGSGEGEVRFFDVQTGRFVRGVRGHSSYIHRIRFGRNGARMVTAGGDSSLKVWVVSSTRGPRSSRPLNGHFNQVYGVAVDRNGMRAISCSGDHSLRLWDLNSGQQLKQFSCSSEVFNVKYYTEGAVAACTEDGKIFLWRP